MAGLRAEEANGEETGRPGRLVALRQSEDQLALARPRLVELSPEQEREAARLLADLFAQTARRRGRSQLREAA